MSAVGDFYAAHAAALQKSLAAQLGSNVIADDALATAIAQLAAREDIDPTQARGWVFIVARNEGSRLARRETRELSLDAPAKGPDAPDGAAFVDLIASPDNTEALIEGRERLNALHQLKPDQANSLRALAAGYSYAEIAEAFDHTRTKVNRSLREGRTSLREREQLVEQDTEAQITAGHAADPNATRLSELAERRQRIAGRQHPAELELDQAIGR